MMVVYPGSYSVVAYVSRNHDHHEILRSPEPRISAKRVGGIISSYATCVSRDQCFF